MNELTHNIYWVGGSSCSGKSSIAKELSEYYNIELYNTDNYAFGKYMFQLDNYDKYPAILKYKNMLLEGMESFAKRKVEESFSAFIEYCEEVFPLMAGDINELASKGKVIVEGAHLFPQLILDYAHKNKSIFLISSKEQQRTIWLKEMNNEIPGGHPSEIENYNKSANKKAIEETRVELHNRIAEYLQNKAIENNFNYIMIDGKKSQNEIQKIVMDRFDFK